MSEASAIDVGDGRAVLAAIDGLAPVGLDDINRDAELQTRTDRKYIVSDAQLDDLVNQFANGCSVLQHEGRRNFAYSTTYHDTSDRRLYRDTAYRRPARFKVRVREYVDSGLEMLEVKTRNGRDRTVKHRVDVLELVGQRRSPHGELTDEMRAYVDAVLDTEIADRLELALRIDFRRITLLAHARDSRCTIDLGLHAEDPRGHSVDPDLIVIETKSENRASVFDRWLWANGVRPTRLSKYCTSMAALDASLPANYWHRQLRAHYPPRRQPLDGRRVSDTV